MYMGSAAYAKIGLYIELNISKYISCYFILKGAQALEFRPPVFYTIKAHLDMQLWDWKKLVSQIFGA
jgi:hypothetical protein